MSTIEHSILFVGGGNMAQAIISGAQNAKVLDPKQVAVLDPNPECRALHPISFENSSDGVQWLESQSSSKACIVLAVKPQMLDLATAPIKEQLNHSSINPLIISILAGVQSSQIRAMFSNDSSTQSSRVLRVMPNTPAQVGLGMSALSPDSQCTDDDLTLAQTIFGSIGLTQTLPEELMDAFTAIAGSGPAYLYYLAESMIQAATQIGIDPGQAQQMVSQTLIGASTLLSQSELPPEQLRAMVTSKNGTTHAATTSMDRSQVKDGIVQALINARDRGRDLSSEISSNKDQHTQPE